MMLLPSVLCVRSLHRAVVIGFVLTCASGGANSLHSQQPALTFDVSNPREEYVIGTVSPRFCPVRVTMLPSPLLMYSAGYHPIAFRVAPVAGRTFLTDGRLTVRLGLGWSGNAECEQVIEIPVQAGQSSAESEFLVNQTSLFSQYFTIRCDWNGVPQRELSQTGFASYSQYNFQGNSRNRLILISAESSQDAGKRQQAMRELRTQTIPFSMVCKDPIESGARSNVNDNAYWWSHFADVAHLPENWLALAAFDQIVADIDDLERLDESGWQRIANYVWCGGSLIVSGEAEDTNRLAKRLAGDWTQVIQASGFDGRLYRAGLGRVGLLNRNQNSDANELIDPSRSKRFARTVDDEYWNWLIPSIGKTPVWTFFGFVFLVVGVAAPAILVWSTRVNRRIWIVLAIPALAVASMTTLFLYAALKDGWIDLARIRSFATLDAKGNGAVWSRQSVFAGNVPGNRIRLRSDSEMTPLSYRKEDGSVQSQDGEAQVYAGVLPPRQQRQFVISHPLQGLKVFQYSSNIHPALRLPEMLNASSSTIQAGVCCNEDGQIFKTEAVAPGGQVRWTEIDADEAFTYLKQQYDKEPLVTPADAPDNRTYSVFGWFRAGATRWNPYPASQADITEENLWIDALKSWGPQTPRKFVVFVDQAPYLDRCLPTAREANSLHTIVGRW